MNDKAMTIAAIAFILFTPIAIRLLSLCHEIYDSRQARTREHEHRDQQSREEVRK